MVGLILVRADLALDGGINLPVQMWRVVLVKSDELTFVAMCGCQNGLKIT